MSKFYGFRTCVVCSTPCTSMNFLDHDGKRYCLACYAAKVNPEHPGIEELRDTHETSLKTWKCQKWSRSDYKLPDGPKSVDN